MRNDTNLAKHLALMDRARIIRKIDGARPTVGDLLLATLAGKPASDVRETLMFWVRERKTGALNVELRRQLAREWLGGV